MKKQMILCRRRMHSEISVSALIGAYFFKFSKEFDFKGRYKINWVFMKLVEAFYFTRH
jgi:hypothetical protein